MCAAVATLKDADRLPRVSKPAFQAMDAQYLDLAPRTRVVERPRADQRTVSLNFFGSDTFPAPLQSRRHSWCGSRIPSLAMQGDILEDFRRRNAERPAQVCSTASNLAPHIEAALTPDARRADALLMLAAVAVHALESHEDNVLTVSCASSSGFWNWPTSSQPLPSRIR